MPERYLVTGAVFDYAARTEATSGLDATLILSARMPLTRGTHRPGSSRSCQPARGSGAPRSEDPAAAIGRFPSMARDQRGRPRNPPPRHREKARRPWSTPGAAYPEGP